ncbi:MarR family winged helix-turn-helix transcriptional regulator [Pseudoteredinibacter isoporae]|uniref:DNA-binding MarR family transcriptional regulator n=1 Tax=Pseudoteredinibacter isoporae TaxID=570281 RepID=A0A7X0JU62_9GAMM|nr:MarR family winged helix-turn-helix transcriptional regulator [Pseudoteredinibacter isoporae]MBB6521894.1 DNA-binding MarR family transcriptional regulator [Pseudoteredinibacter isoporae]NHO87438.1 winged helix-turn-helix transcriptional regulator [Pseudoteredinibacter isoporae]NIB24231.1 winged helix-turn-helix transcriptional regulator [Pseudoteredinibacter isoporae]
MSQLELHKRVERLSELYKVDLRRSAARFGLLPVHLEMLHYLSICNQYSDTPIAVTEYLGQTKGTVSQSIKVLENKDLLRKVADANDRRLVHLRLTDEGRQVLTEALPATWLGSAFENLESAARQQVLAGLDILLMQLVVEGDVPGFGVCRSCKHHSRGPQGEPYCQLLAVSLEKNGPDQLCREHRA